MSKVSSFKGVNYKGRRSNRKCGWYAQITHKGHKHEYGPYKTDKKAAEKYEQMKKKFSFDTVKPRSLKQYRVRRLKGKLFRGKQLNLETDLEPVSYERAERKQFFQHERRRIAVNQEWKCNYCYKLLTEFFEIDHLIPLQYGGSNRYSNIQALCTDCHKFKTSFLDPRVIKPFISQVKEDAIQFTRDDVLTLLQEHKHTMLCVDPPDNNSLLV